MYRTAFSTDFIVVICIMSRFKIQDIVFRKSVLKQCRQRTRAALSVNAIDSLASSVYCGSIQIRMQTLDRVGLQVWEDDSTVKLTGELFLVVFAEACREWPPQRLKNPQVLSCITVTRLRIQCWCYTHTLLAGVLYFSWGVCVYKLRNEREIFIGTVYLQLN